MLTRGRNTSAHEEAPRRARVSNSPADEHWDDPGRNTALLPRDSGKRRSLYRTMRDGTRLAIDVTLPTAARPGDKLPTILRQTRYFRSVEMPRALDFRASRDAFDIVAPTRERFLAQGYAWVDVDVRGSGVSSGSWPVPWSKGEVEDGAEIVDFIVREPWSNGRVGSTGISYEGTTSEMLLVNHHEAVRAVAPRFSLLCAYEDVAFPGGAHLGWFTEGWARYNRLLDDHRQHRAMAELIWIIARARTWEPGAVWGAPLRALLERLGPNLTKEAIGLVFGAFLRGGRRVDEDPLGSLRAEALRDHIANGDVHALCLSGAYRDDRAGADLELGFSGVSPRGNLAALASSSAAVFGYGGWLDGGYAQAAGRRFASLAPRKPDTRLLIGPWSHAGFLTHDPYGRTVPASFPHERELLRFFDAHLREGGAPLEDDPVRYFTLVENRWKTASKWPPETVRPFTLRATKDRSLVLSKDGAREPDGTATVRDDETFGTGERSRWRGLLAGFVPADYPDFQEKLRGQVVFTSAPFDRGITITGHPVVRLVARADADFVVMAYLVDIDRQGHTSYITEGQLRATHRKVRDPEPGYEPLGPYRSFETTDVSPARCEDEELAFALLPTSYMIKPGHRVGLALTLGDKDHFARIAGAAKSIEIVCGSSIVELPVEP